MKRLTTYTIQLISGLLLALLTAGCVADRNVSDCITEGEDVELEFALQVPALETSLRQLDANQEKQIKSIQVLVFNTDGINDEAQETFAYEAPVRNFETSTADGYTRIRCKLTSTAKPMRVVCIANANINTQGFANKTKGVILNEDVMKELFTEKWATDGSKFIPMWGESDKQAVSRDTKFNDCTASNDKGVIHLVRALARIDVGCSFDETEPADDKAKGNTDFKIKSVRVYRYAQSMYVTGTQALTFRMDGATRDPLPHTPEGMKPADDNNPLIFTAETEEDAKGYVRNIYIPEISNHDNGQNKGKDARTCLVIGGSYKGGKETYYRVDFITRRDGAPKDEIKEQLDVLRNHRYRFNITKVAGPGTDKPEEALKTEPVNLTCDVVVWDEGKVDKIVYDGQYYLSVSKDKFHFGKDATSENYTIRTNWPKGYKIVDKDGKEWPKTGTQGSWAYFTEPAGQTFAVEKDMTSTVNVLENTTNAVRTIAPTELFVKAGRIKWPLKITQSDKIELDIKLYESNASGEYSPVNPINRLEVKQKDVKYVAVKYTKDAQLERRMMTDKELYTWVQVWDRPADGLALYRVELHDGVLAEDQFALSEVSRFHANKGGAEADADLTVYNIIDDALPFGDRALTWNLMTTPKNFALINDKLGFFFIKSSAPYRLKIVSIDLPSGSAQTDNTKVVHGWHKGMVVKEGQGLLTGDKIEFKPYDYVQGDDGVTAGSLSGASITFVIEHTDDSRYFPNKTFTIHFYAGIVQPTANCYIIKKGQELPIIFPVSERINEAADWYNAYEDSFDEAVYTRLKSYPARKNDYTNTGRALLNRLEANDEVWSVAVLWSTIDPTGSTSGLKVSKVVYQKTGQHNYMSVQTEGNVQPGSAVVACMKDGKVLWSWHIWVVDTYPWESAQTSAPLPVMNRNLGAAKKPAAGSVMGSNWPDPREMGMYYQYGRKDPFFVYESLTGSFNQTNVPKIYHSDPKWEQGDAERSCGLGTDIRLFRMRDLIQQPTKMAYRDAQNEYILEFGTRDPNVAAKVPSSAASLAIWQGREAALEAKNSVRMVADLKTIKTPFDPSPYGWKIPSAGREADYIRKAAWMNYRHYGIFYRGNYKGLEYVAAGDDCFFHLATRVSSFDVLGTFSYKEDGKVFGYGPTTRGNASKGEFCPSNAMPVRPIINERETDYRRYTEEGFYMDKR
ncbi:fimbrial protein [Porphyromonas uenonis]|uniref:fimbrial protein n=2 Tax=Porphyromonas uenonis TaxID=281920 RepID=UPI000481C257|nr:fimbrial protein [Porphyromonas uenonis]